MRALSIALDAIGAVLAFSGCVGLASLAHPYLAAVVAGVLLLFAGILVEPRRRRG